MASAGKKAGMFIAGSFVGLVLSGGGTYAALYLYAQDGGGSEESTADTASNQPAGDEAPSGGDSAGDVCAQAASCCEDYVAAVSEMMPTVNVESTCQGVRMSAQAGPTGQAACRTAIDAWRTSLTQMSKPIPDSCGDGGGTGSGANDGPAEPEPAPAGDQAAGGSPCERAEGCCEAYVTAVSDMMPTVNVETTCQGVRMSAQAGPTGNAACEAAISAWRTSLTQMNKPVPEICQ